MALDDALPAVKRVLKHFRSDRGEAYLPTGEDMADLVTARCQPGLLFDHYSPGDIEEAFDRYDITKKLSARGFADLCVGLSGSEEGKQVVSVTAAKGGHRHVLGEAILRSGQFVTDARFAPSLAGQRFKMLFIQWLRLQDPTRSFADGRPALPGQIHPGLGVGREVMLLFLGLARRLEFSGIMVCPEFAHNAVLYFYEFRFFDPASHGRFEALLGLKEGLSLAEFAWGVERGCVDDLATGKPFRWFHEEMLRATDTVLAGYLSSEEYLVQAARAREACSLAIDRARLAGLGPIPSHGFESPDGDHPRRADRDQHPA